MVSAATADFYSPRKIPPAPETKRRRQRVQTDGRQRTDGGAGAAGKDDADPAAAREFSHASSGGPCARMFLCKRAADSGKGGARCGCAGAASALRSA